MDQIGPTGIATRLIHFISEVMAPPTDNMTEGPPVLQWRVACMPNMTEFHKTRFHPPVQRTNEVHAVTCPQCKKSQIFLKEVERLKQPAKHRVSHVKA